MHKPRQTTLFQSWAGGKKPASGSSSKRNDGASQCQTGGLTHGEVIDLCDDVTDDDLLLLALEESLKDAPRTSVSDAPPIPSTSRNGSCTSKPSSSAAGGATLFQAIGRPSETKRTTLSVQPSEELQWKPSAVKTLKPSSLGFLNTPRERTTDVGGSLIPGGGTDSDGDNNYVQLTEEDLTAFENLEGFDKVAGQLWIYPTNYPVRDYQYNIVQEALFANTLVVLPTGLGKTFIAAVVMYNFYRWYPRAKVIFMAPTKPLVAQQIEACFNIMGIPQDVTAEMTGSMQPAERKKAWHERRVFFLTPQVLMNDLSRGVCPALLVKCLVVDEAHKALGNHAYCQVVRELAKYEGPFRVLGLSATPGSDMKAVQQVMNNLLVSHIELRGEESADIKPYTHERSVEKVVVPLGEELTLIQEKYMRVMEVVVSRLRRTGVLYNRDVKSLSKFLVLKARDAFRQNPPHNLQRQEFGVVEGDFALAMSLYHGYDLLLLHGLRSLYSYLQNILTGDKGHGRTRAALNRNADFNEIMALLKGKYTEVKNTNPSLQLTQSASQLAKPFTIGHPKMAKLQDIALEHFTKLGNNELGEDGHPGTSRIMIFAQYRDSVNEITEMLNRHRPMVKAMSFIGQSSVGKSAKGFTQKEQLTVMRLFREGGYNTLISTCVGEEGLDIGDVDLIICYDAHKSPIRLVQRMGRTGRKRKGRIVMLVTEGKEEQIYNQSQYSKRSIHKAIENGAKSLIFYARNARMVPMGMTPRCHQMHITIHQEYKTVTKSRGCISTSSKTSAKPGKGSKNGSGENDGFLTDDELRYWSSHYKVRESDVPAMPLSTFVTLKKTPHVGPPQTKDSRKELSLREWLPWQNRLQETKKVGHSMKSRHLVELIQFMEVQGVVGKEDNYGLEMKTYLNEEDINRTGGSVPTTRSILRFCTQVTSAAPCPEKSAKRKLTDTGTSRKRRRKIRELPTLSSSESSNDDLPEFNLHRPSRGDKADQPDFETKASSPSPDGIPRASSPPPDGVQEAERNLVRPESSQNQRQPKKGKCKGKGKGKSSKKTKGIGRLSESIREDYVDIRRSTTKRKKKKKSSALFGSMSVIQLIDDHDDDDFDGGCQGKDEGEQDQTGDKPPEVVGRFQDDAQISKQEAESGTSTVAASTNDPTFAGLEDDRNTEDRLHMSQLLPVSTFQAGFLLSQMGNSQKYLSSGRVSTPPPLEELASALEDMDRKGRVSPVDILQLIDSWESEKQDGTVGLKSNRFLSIDQFSPVQGQASEHQTQIRAKVSVSNTTVKVVGALSGKEQTNQIEEIVPGTTGPFGIETMDVDADFANDVFFDGSFQLEGEVFGSYMETDEKSGSRPTTGRQKNDPVVSSETTEENQGEQTLSPVPQRGWNKSISPVVSAASLLSSSFPVQHATSRTPSLLKTGGKTLEPSNTSTPLVPSTKGEKQPGTLRPAVLFADREAAPITPPAKKDLSVSIINDSFFDDANGELLLAALDTPQGQGQPQGPPRSPLLTKASNSMMENTQLTFTQALACLHETLDSSVGFAKQRNSSVSLHETHPSNEESNESKSDRSVVTESPKSEPQIPLENCGTNIGPVAKETDQAEDQKDVEDKGGDVPLFDLGFDLDEFDDDMIIPPSPQRTQPFSQRRKLRLTSQSNIRTLSSQQTNSNVSGNDPISAGDNNFKANIRQSLDFNMSMDSQCHQEGVTSRMLMNNTEKHSILETTDVGGPHEGSSWRRGKGSLEPHEMKVEVAEDPGNAGSPTSPSLLTGDVSPDMPTRCEDPRSTRKLAKFRLPSNGNRISVVLPDGPPRPNPPPVAVIAPCVTQKPPGEEGVFEMGFFDDFPDFFEDDTVEGWANPDPQVGVGGKMQEDPGHIPGTPKYNQTVTDVGSDADDSFIHVRRRKGAPRILQSPDSPEPLDQRRDQVDMFKTPLKPAPKLHKPRRAKVVSSEEEDESSPFVAHTRSKRKRVAAVSNLDLTLDEDDDFEDISKPPVNKSTRNQDHLKSRKPAVMKSSRTRTRTGGFGFLEIEADLSGEDDSSDDSDGSDLDELEGSFINDASQMSQDPSKSALTAVSQVLGKKHKDNDPPDMRAVYMQSVRSPKLSGGRYKLAYNRRVHLDVFSQVPEQDSDYGDDSFVVSGDDDHDLSAGDEDEEVTVLENVAMYDRGHCTRRQARLVERNKVKQKSKHTGGERKRRVIRVVDSSSEEERDEKKQDTTLSVRPLVRRIIASDSSTSSKMSSADEQSKKQHRSNEAMSGVSTMPALSTDPSQGRSLQQRCQQRLQSEHGNSSKTAPTTTANSILRCSKENVDKIARALRNCDTILTLNKSKVANRTKQKQRAKQKQLPVSRSGGKSPEPLPLNQTGGEGIHVRGKVQGGGSDSDQKGQSFSDSVEVGSRGKDNVDDKAVFSLGSNLFDDDWDDELGEDAASTCRVDKVAAAPLPQAAEISSATRISQATSGPTTNCVASVSAGAPDGSTAGSGREKRLRLSRLKQMEFRMKFQSSQIASGVQQPPQPRSFHGSQIQNFPRTPHAGVEPSQGSAPSPASILQTSLSTLQTPQSTAQRRKLVILVNSRELSSAQDLMSALRFRHHLQTVVHQIGPCDYILSNRMAIDRNPLSGFTNGTQKAKLLDRVRHMCELFDRPCLIVERDRVKPGEEKHIKPMVHTKYVDMVLASLSQTHIKVFFSESQEESAGLLADLANQELKKGVSIQVPTELSTPQDQVLRFYLTLPRVSYITALNFSHRFRTIQEFVGSSSRTLEKRGQISSSRAGQILEYLQRCFDRQMTGVQNR